MGSADSVPEMEPALVSVGLASYNRPQLLRRAIDSIRAQSYRNLEILVSDNGSTDPEVHELIKNFAQNDHRVKFVLHPENRGAFFNFCWLLSQAKGEYFIWLADDDYWCDGFLESLMASARQSGAALTYGRASVVDVPVAEKDAIAKEMSSTTGAFSSVLRFIRFDSDSIFYGVFRRETGQKLCGFLRNWRLPVGWASDYPFLEYNFVSYVFLYGILATGGFCNASSDKTIHYVGGRAPFRNLPSLGRRHLVLLLAYVLIHMQMVVRFARSAFTVGSLIGALLAPVAGSFLFLRRIGMILSQRLRKNPKNIELSRSPESSFDSSDMQ
ncbi:MAG: GalNAc(5)-diNAcBac-PP-undecaprenol beta-1,3-glucosyltransferase [Betaproteobacteria bacterium ADurb.Bin341]|nr:MAG: GalNAc(5)-diNAcBac-PP-undecaprenol beta-1,3-glucosyltransferase [Betaproteobacteria bacterium ADurb.Bin341]